MRIATLAIALFTPVMILTAAHVTAAAPYNLDTAHAEGAGILRCPAPRGGIQHVAIVFRDTYGEREKYALSVAGQPLGEFDANLGGDDLMDGNRNC